MRGAALGDVIEVAHILFLCKKDRRWRFWYFNEEKLLKVNIIIINTKAASIFCYEKIVCATTLTSPSAAPGVCSSSSDHAAIFIMFFCRNYSSIRHLSYNNWNAGYDKIQFWPQVCVYILGCLFFRQLLNFRL